MPRIPQALYLALYRVLIEAKVPDAQARLAAEDITEYGVRLATVERDVAILKWLVGLNIALMALILGKVW